MHQASPGYKAFSRHVVGQGQPGKSKFFIKRVVTQKWEATWENPRFLSRGLLLRAGCLPCVSSMLHRWGQDGKLFYKFCKVWVWVSKTLSNRSGPIQVWLGPGPGRAWAGAGLGWALGSCAGRGRVGRSEQIEVLKPKPIP